jgi:MFS family permease
MEIWRQQLTGFLRRRTARHRRSDGDHVWKFTPAETSRIPGSPASPDHPLSLRIVYAPIGVLIGITGGLGSGLVAANLPYLQGALGLDYSQIAWLPTAYLITSSITGCVLVKYRQRFGIRSFCLVFLSLYAAIVFAHLFVDSLASAIAVRAASGISGSALTVLSVYYLGQALPLKHRRRALVLGVGMPQLAQPLAQLFPVDALALDNWRGLSLFELGLSLLSLAAVILVRLPPNKRSPAFEILDGVSFLFYASAIIMFGAAVGMGSYFWWTDRAWIGWFLALSAPCLAIALSIEYFRVHPLIDVRWLGKSVLLRFAVLTIVARVAFSEESVGAIGFLRNFGLTNDEIRPFSIAVFLATIAGLGVGALAVSPTKLTPAAMMAVTLVAIGSFMDVSAGTLTRAPQLMPAQVLIAFGTTVFIGPSFVFGLNRVLDAGGSTITSFVALFGVTQAVGALIGSALVQTTLLVREQYHLDEFAAQLSLQFPLVASEVASFSDRYFAVLQDPALRTAEGVSQLGQQALLEAQVLAYDDVFLMISALCTVAVLYLVAVIALRWWTALRAGRAQA